MITLPRRLAVLALLLVALASAPAHSEEEGPTCRHWAVLLPEDGGQLRVYDGIRKGLEVAQLERLCLKDLKDDLASFKAFVAEHAARPEPRPLVFAVGRRAGDRLLAAGFLGPGVYVSTEVTAKGELLAPEPVLPPRVARVRAEVAAEAWGQMLREALGVETPRIGLAWADMSEDALPALTRFAEAGGVTFQGREPRHVSLVLRLGLGERIMELPVEEAPAAVARRMGLPLASDDPADFGRGAALLLLPDAERLGRMAAEAGRRLWRGEDHGPAPLVVRESRVVVDLDTCEAAGLRLPLTFLARASDVRASSARRPRTPVGTR